MVAALVGTLGEGFEAFLIVALSIAFLRRSGGRHLVPAVQWGIALSVVFSIIGAWLLSAAENQSLWRGWLAVSAAIAVAILTGFVVRTSRHVDAVADETFAQPPSGHTGAAWLALLTLTLLVITRKGMDATLLMATLFFQIRSVPIAVSAAAGFTLAAILAWLWSRFGHRLPPRPFFYLTALALAILVVRLFVYGVAELREAGVLAAAA